MKRDIIGTHTIFELKYCFTIQKWPFPMVTATAQTSDAVHDGGDNMVKTKKTRRKTQTI